MKLHDGRFNEICEKILLSRLTKEGINLKPLEVKREIQNMSKDLDVPVKELAEVYKIMLSYLSGYTDSKLDEIINS